MTIAYTFGLAEFYLDIKEENNVSTYPDMSLIAVLFNIIHVAVCAFRNICDFLLLLYMCSSSVGEAVTLLLLDSGTEASVIATYTILIFSI